MNPPAPTRLWNRNFALWWLGTAQSSLGSALAGIALSFLVLDRTGSAGAMGVTLALGMLPGLLAPLAGTLVDRIPLKVPLVLGDVLRGLIVLGVGLWALGGDVPLLAINALSLLQGLIGALYGPAAGSVLPKLVPVDQLARANGLLAAANQGANLVGLLGGGLLVGRVGSAPALIFDGASFLVMAALLLFVALPKTAAVRERRPFWTDFRAGFARVRASRVLTLVPLMALCINASIAPLQMLLPKRMVALGAGAAGYGTFLALMTAGVVAGSLLMAALGRRAAPRPTIGLGLAGIGVSLLGMAATGSIGALWACAVFMGLSMGLTNTGLPTLMQTIVEPEFRGRVFSFLGMVSQIGMPLTLLALAPIADRLSLAVIFSVAGVVTVLMSLAFLRWGREAAPRGPIPPTVAPTR